MTTSRIFFLFLIIPVLSIGQQINENTKSMKTYGFSDPNPVPRVGRVYPYFRFDGYTDKGEMRNWKFVDLENAYIKVSVTPEIGGKIWGAYEKSTNFPFVYYNNVVKFRDVAMRGAWTSGGIELNFGDIGHDPTVSNPVDYFTRKNANGSLSCFVGAYDWASRTKWVVEINLPKDKAFFTTKSTWYNSSPVDQTYYHWMNAGFRAAGDLEFAFPGTNFIGHGGELNSWPKNADGRDINFYEKNNFGTYKSYHILGKTDDFFGGYWHKDKVGFIHYSPYHEKLGKKVWVWGLSRQGMIWENLLTDTDGQYVELQSGRLFNQAATESINSPFKHVDFKPQTTDSWIEHWYPIKDIGGISQGESWGAWAIKKNANGLRFALSPAQAINDTLTWLVGSQKFQKFLNLEPMSSYADSVEVLNTERVAIYLGNKKLFNTEEKEKTIERPLESPKDFDWNTEYGQFLKAKSMANQRQFEEAEKAFLKLLLKNPYHIPAMGEMAQLAFRKGLYQKAINHAKKALSINTYDPLANYTLGLASFQMQKYNAAKDAFAVASLSPWYRSPSLIALAKLSIIDEAWNKAENIIDELLLSDAKNEEVKHLKLVILRKSKRVDEAEKRIMDLLEHNPLDHFARAENYLLTTNKESETAFVGNIRNELPHENYIEMALWYKSINEQPSALALLALAPPHPMVSLWKAAIGKNEKEAEAGLRMSPNLVFPFRHEDIGLFEGLLSKPQFAANWVLKYYYGILLWSLNRNSEAEAMFLQCRSEPTFYPFYLAKADLFKHNKGLVQASLLKAHALAQDKWRTVKELADYYSTEKTYAKALSINEAFTPTEVHVAYILKSQKAELLLNLKRYEECLALLKTLNMLPSEGAKGTHDLFRKANILYAMQFMKAKKNGLALQYLDEAETWPENLGSGKPYDVDNELTKALKAYLKNGNRAKLLSTKNKLTKSDASLLLAF